MTVLLVAKLQVECFHKKTEGKGLKILTSKQMCQKWPIAPKQVKSDHASENLLIEIRKSI